MTVFLRWLVAAALVVFSMVLVSSLLAGTVHHGRMRAMLTLAVIVAGGSLIVADLSAPQSKREKVAGWIGAGTTVVGAVLSFILIWTEWIVVAHVWRAWWVFSGVSLTIAHILLIRQALKDRPWRVWLRRITTGGVLVFASTVIGLTFREDVLLTPPAWMLIPIWIALGVETVGSLLLWFFARPDPKPVTVPWRAFRWGWYITSPVLLIALGFYLGRVTKPGEGIFGRGAGVLAGLDAKVIDDQIDVDLDRLRNIVESVEKARARAEELRRTVVVPMRAEGRTVFSPAEDDAVRSLFFSYLSYRTALLRMVAYYQGFESVPDTKRRQRCFLVGFAAGTTIYGSSLALVALCHDEPLVRDKLNEAEEQWGVPAGMFDRIHESVALEHNQEVFEEMCAYFEERRSEWRQCGLDEDDRDWLESALEHGVTAVVTSPMYGKRPPLRLILERVKKDAYTPVYAVQSLVSTWIGDTRLVTKRPCISREQIDEMRPKLEPGDIILERRNWFLSNAFLPGFWPHAELYVGTPEQVERLGLRQEPAVRDRWEKFAKLAPDGEPHCIIESISEGVAFSSLSEGCRADYIVVLRPRVSVEEKRKAILRAFAHVGKPYDFEFDFFSSDKLVCTELVYRAYEGVLHFELKKIMGRMTLPAVEMARKHARERGTKGQETEFVLFLDTARGAEMAGWADEEEFCRSAERPRAFNE